MTIQHKSLKDEILFILGRASEPLDSGQIYERCTLAEEVKRVSDALWILRTDGKIAFAEGDGRKRYVLAKGTHAPAPAGKAGRPETSAAPAASPTVSYGFPLTAPAVEIPTLGDPGIGLDGVAGKTRRAKADKPKADHIAQAGKMVDPNASSLDDAGISRGLDLVEDRLNDERLADALIAKNREQLRHQAPRWSVDQCGAVEIHSGPNSIGLSPLQARVLAEMVLVMHDVLEQHA